MGREKRKGDIRGKGREEDGVEGYEGNANSESATTFRPILWCFAVNKVYRAPVPMY